MPGLGRPPKPANQRRNRAKPRVETISLDASTAVQVPKASRSWHPLAKRWYASLASSPASVLYVDSDWMTAWAIAEAMSREYKPRPVKVGDEIVMMEMPVSAAALNSWRLMMSNLMVTAGDRRRMRVETVRPKPVDDDAADLAWFEDARRRLRGEHDRFADL